MKVTADDIAQFLASTPPRRVPAQVRRAALGGHVGWVVPLFGFCFGTFGMFFVGIFFPWRVADDWRLDRSGVTTPGMVRSATDSNMTINDTRVVEYVFAYSVPGEKALVASCYTTGRRWHEGQRVTVCYLASDPAMARIEGARLSQGGGVAGLMVLIFPLIGYSIVVWFLVAGWRIRRLLEHGRVAEVDVRSVEATKMSVNYQTVYRITLSALPGTSGQTVSIKRWATAEVNLLTQHALQKQPIFVLYDPRWPWKPIFPEAWIAP